MKAQGGFDLVLFDLDGTLVATAPELHDAVSDTLLQLGLRPVQERQVENWIGHGTRELLTQAVAWASGVGAAAVRSSESFAPAAAQFDRNYAGRCGTRSRLYPHTREVLVELRARGVKLAVVTNKESAFTRAVLSQHALLPLFDRVVSGDCVPSRKPDPAGIFICMKALGVGAARSLMVGDSAVDVAVARNAGIPVWAVTYGYNMGQPIAAHRPDRLLADLRPLLETAARSRDVC
jgi:phosphoglycolate phosphatase